MIVLNPRNINIICTNFVTELSTTRLVLAESHLSPPIYFQISLTLPRQVVRHLNDYPLALGPSPIQYAINEEEVR